ncbi:MAG: SDR family oxidoreductase [Phenylobacterium sp.]|uniref:SDR family NAD(P)-dependent oxidoreductase n=1 Tax=Phenylobacterium sp. TaxID=1871053 RepID=UPI002715895E|nr:SDR family oxidoreductase [Phenylobacterium sp.]MDO8911327.1 SDR family oxidoreductase [Phenylobacterium sp.]MDO9248817.1 SDR family oxidoreductase [Phenylobacterium sp.]MDP3635647.1 SDR family oxidoreductase [Phenylobacterium sp.]MDP3867231.1 SDR family oxidoreductase [Phenylobacterium sp.]HQT52750.1 SDR family oxidoreductase [Phenylobacterium sp.]
MGERLAGRTALITGAAGGIGLACAEAFAAEGCDLALIDIDEKRLADAARDLAKRSGRTVHAVPCDVSDAAKAQKAVIRSAALLSRIDILVNNAGILAAGDILDCELEDFDRVMAVNLRAPFVIGQTVARHMVDAKIKGSIINMSSVNAVLAIPNQLAYVTSKGGISQLTKSMALALAPHGVRVNAIGPGTISTDILKGVMENDDARRRALARTPLKRFGEPSEVGSVAVFLASEDASYMTGQTLYPDGGRLALNYTVAVD